MGFELENLVFIGVWEIVLVVSLCASLLALVVFLELCPRRPSSRGRHRASTNLRVAQVDLGHARLETRALYTHVVDKEWPTTTNAERDPTVEALAWALAGLSAQQRRALAETLTADSEEPAQ